MQNTQIQVAVNVGKESSFPGAVHQLTTEGAVAMFQAETCPELIKGRAVQLVFSSLSNDIILPVDAKLTHSTEMPPMRCYAFSFDETLEEVESLVTSAFGRDRRRSTRVRLDSRESDLAMIVPPDVVPLLPKIPGVAVLENDCVSVAGSACDLSHWGVSARVDPRAEMAFVASDRILVELDLEEFGKTLLVAGSIRHRQEKNGMFLYGIEFDWKKTEDAAAKQRALTLALVRLRKPRS